MTTSNGTIVDDTKSSNISLDGDASDFKSTAGIFAAAAAAAFEDDDYVERGISRGSDISNVEILEKDLDYADYVDCSGPESGAEAMPSDDRKPPPPTEDNCDGLRDVRTALSRMTASDLERFLNVYDFLTDPRPKIRIRDVQGTGAAERPSSEERLDGERFERDHRRVSTDGIDGNGSRRQGDPVDEYHVTFFDVHNHIGRWKKRLRPMMNRIDDLAQASRIVQQRSSVPPADVRPQTYRKITGNFNKYDDNRDVNAIRSRYLSNVTESGSEFRPKISGDRPTDTENHVATGNAPVRPVAGNDIRRSTIPDTDQDRDQDTVKLTLLTPSSAYLKKGYRETSADELEVKTYSMI